jgi:hypothetical protein
LQHKQQMNQLISLTEAVRSNTTRDDLYQEFNKSEQVDSQRRERELSIAKAILANQIERMANSNIEWPQRVCLDKKRPEPPPPPLPLPVEAEIRAMEASTRTRMALHEEDDRKPAAKPKPKPPQVPVPQSQPAKEKEKKKKKKKRPRHSIEPDPYDDRHTTTTTTTRSGYSGAPVAVAAEARVPDTNYSATEFAIPSPRRKKRRLEQPALASPPTEPYAARVPSPSEAARQSGSMANRRRKQLSGSKTCHSCKNLKVVYLKCCYFLFTGSRCGKYYCAECLSADYGQDVTEEEKDNEWQ